MGDIVLVQDETLKRGKWKLGKIERLILGRDQEIRGASVKVITNDNALSINRPVQKLFPLEVSSNEDVGQNKAKGVEKESEGKAENLEEEKGNNRDNGGLNDEKDGHP